MAIVFLLKESTLQSHQKPFSFIMHWFNYSDKDEALVVISVSLTEVKWAESLMRTLKVFSPFIFLLMQLPKMPLSL